MKNLNTSQTSIPRCLFFVLGLAAGVTLSLFFITNQYSSVQIQFQNIISRIRNKQNESENSELLELAETGNTTSLDVLPWEKLRVLCMVMTYHAHHATRVRAVKETWGRHCDILLFMSDIDDPSIPTVNTNTTNSVKGMWDMSQFAHKYIQKHYSGKFDWVLKADCDTYAFIENMKMFLVNYSTSKPLFFGFKAKVPILFMSGAGFLISHETQRYMLDVGMNGSYKACSENSKQFEDLAMAECMAQLNVTFADSRDQFGRERFFPESVLSHAFPYNDMNVDPFLWYKLVAVYPIHIGLDCCAKDPILFHHVSHQHMYMMEYLTYLTKQPPRPRFLQTELPAKSTFPHLTPKAPTTKANP